MSRCRSFCPSVAFPVGGAGIFNHIKQRKYSIYFIQYIFIYRNYCKKRPPQTSKNITIIAVPNPGFNICSAPNSRDISKTFHPVFSYSICYGNFLGAHEWAWRILGTNLRACYRTLSNDQRVRASRTALRSSRQPTKLYTKCALFVFCNNTGGNYRSYLRLYFFDDAANRPEVFVPVDMVDTI